MKIWQKILLVGLSLTVTACERLLFPDVIEDNKVENFDLLWKTLNAKYAYFELKEVDWQMVYDTCRPKVDELNSPVALFDLMADMLNLLQDGHTNLISGFDIGRNWNWYLHRPVNFDWNVIERHYLGDDYRITGPFYHSWLLPDSVGYVYYGSFSGDFSASQLDLIMQRFDRAKGLILDLRDNGGGSLGNALALAGRLVMADRIAFFEEAKNGAGPNDFTSAQPVYVRRQGFFYGNPVFVLTNRQCYSATNSFAAMVKGLPQVRLLGDTTGGGGGLPVYGDLPNGWTFRYSATRTFTPDGHSLELGIAPDIAVDLDSLALRSGIDSYIESARILLQ